jgi:ATP-dependent Clp protease adaptor protein ClpS
MIETAEPMVLPDVEREQDTDPRDELEPGFLVICWDDPVNLMDYVTHVSAGVSLAQSQGGVSHAPGPSAGAQCSHPRTMERAEHYVHQLHQYGLKATMERD